MKLSEKTLELNICAQLHRAVHPRFSLFWFGLTQRQEARMGFDACTKLGGRLLIFQFKASNHLLKGGARKFQLEHQQMLALQRLAGARRRSIFYAFPLVGNTRELGKNPDLLGRTWLLDVSQLPTMAAPTKKDGTPRLSGGHNAYAWPGTVEIRSDPVKAELANIAEFAAGGFPGMDGLGPKQPDDIGALMEARKYFTRGARALLLYNRDRQSGRDRKESY
jgi:hypothetical protein